MFQLSRRVSVLCGRCSFWYGRCSVWCPKRQPCLGECPFRRGTCQERMKHWWSLGRLTLFIAWHQATGIRVHRIRMCGVSEKSFIPVAVDCTIIYVVKAAELWMPELSNSSVVRAGTGLQASSKLPLSASSSFSTSSLSSATSVVVSSSVLVCSSSFLALSSFCLAS